MIACQGFSLSDDLVEGVIYRARSTPSNQLTLITKRRGTIYAMGWGNGHQVMVSCDEWDRLYRPGRKDA